MLHHPDFLVDPSTSQLLVAQRRNQGLWWPRRLKSYSLSLSFAPDLPPFHWCFPSFQYIDLQWTSGKQRQQNKPYIACCSSVSRRTDWRFFRFTFQASSSIGEDYIIEGTNSSDKWGAAECEALKRRIFWDEKGLQEQVREQKDGVQRWWNIWKPRNVGCLVSRWVSLFPKVICHLRCFSLTWCGDSWCDQVHCWSHWCIVNDCTGRAGSSKLGLIFFVGFEINCKCNKEPSLKWMVLCRSTIAHLDWHKNNYKNGKK